MENVYEQGRYEVCTLYSSRGVIVMSNSITHAGHRVDAGHAVDGADVHERLDVARLLEESLLHSVDLLAGEKGLDGYVSWCLPWEGTAEKDARIDGVVLFATVEQLTTAGPRGVRAVTERGAAAVFVAADGESLTGSEWSRCGVPVLLLPAGVDYAALNRLVAELSLSKEAHVLRYGVTVHRSLAELLYRGSGLAALGRQLTQLSSCPVLVLDPHARKLAAEYEGAEEMPAYDAVIAALQALPLTAIDNPGPRTGDLVRTVELDVEARRLTCVLSPIVLGGRHDGWVVIVELDAEPQWHELARHRVIVEQATMIIGSEMLRLRSVEVAEERARGDFVHALLHGRFTNTHELHSRAEHYGFDVAATYGVVVARGLGVVAGGDSLSRMLGLARTAAQLMPRSGSQTLATVVGDVLVVVRQTGGGRGEERTGTEDVATFASLLSRDLARRVDHDVVVAYGRPVQGAERIVDCYREARIALGVCERLRITEVSGYGELRVYAALLDLAEGQRGRLFAEELLTPLRRANRKGGGDLEDAVLAYVESGGNLNAAARKLALHRNTMLYKLDRASRALGLDLRDAENQFAVWLAYRIEMLGDVQAAVGREFSPRS